MDIIQLLSGNQPEWPKQNWKCEWCGKEIKPSEEAIGQIFLTTVFGYVYCSKECLRGHIKSK